MKQICIIATFIITTLLGWSDPAPTNSLSLTSVQDAGQSLLDALSLDYEKSSEGIHKAMQKYFLRAPDKAVWEFKSPYEDKKDTIKDLLKPLNVMSAIEATGKNYDQVILVGTFVPTMRNMINYLKTIAKNGTKFGKVFFVSGDRPLEKKFFESQYVLQTPSIMDETVLLQSKGKDLKAPGKDVEVTTESDAAQFLWEQASDDLPGNLKDMIYFVKVPSTSNPDGTLHTPNRLDTFQELTLRPGFSVDDSTLIISNSPFIQYDESAYRYVMLSTSEKKDISNLEVCGPVRQDGFLSVGIQLDNLARLENNLYEMHKIKINSNSDKK
jgi:hypothetical protein